MKIPDSIRKTVGFLAYLDQISNELKPVGSAFLLGPQTEPGSERVQRVFIVTARHVIDGLRRNGCDSTYVRLNAKMGLNPSLISICIPIDDWKFHPSDGAVDVAVVERSIPPEADHLVIPLSFGATDEKLIEHDVDLGDEVFISGLFKHHYGTDRNIPIVRIGNLAALNEERVNTPKYGDIDAYLIEARSIGGLSGSPVFVNLNGTRAVRGTVNIGGSTSILLLGLIHGHFDVKADILENFVDMDVGLREETVNAGIAVVVPFKSIVAVIESIPERELFFVEMAKSDSPLKF